MVRGSVQRLLPVRSVVFNSSVDSSLLLELGSKLVL